MVTFVSFRLCRFWRWAPIPIICTGWQLYELSHCLLLSWVQKLHVLNCCQWSSMHLKTGNGYVELVNVVCKIVFIGSFWMRDLITLCRVSNIKFNVAKVLQSLIPIVDQSVSLFFSANIKLPFFLFYLFIVLCKYWLCCPWVSFHLLNLIGL
jgi:hypothetical protein